MRGERTPQIFVKTNEAVGRCIPASRSVVIPAAARTMSYQNPRVFNREVLAFIAKQK